MCPGTMTLHQRPTMGFIALYAGWVVLQWRVNLCYTVVRSKRVHCSFRTQLDSEITTRVIVARWHGISWKPVINDSRRQFSIAACQSPALAESGKHDASP
jgi:hypothetical protein